MIYKTQNDVLLALFEVVKAMLNYDEKAILGSDVGITPMNNGETIRLCIPPVTEERRKQLVKIASGAVEEAKVSIVTGKQIGRAHV